MQCILTSVIYNFDNRANDWKRWNENAHVLGKISILNTYKRIYSNQIWPVCIYSLCSQIPMKPLTKSTTFVDNLIVKKCLDVSLKTRRFLKAQFSWQTIIIHSLWQNLLPLKILYLMDAWAATCTIRRPWGNTRF